jgi:hypothetical protein
MFSYNIFLVMSRKIIWGIVYLLQNVTIVRFIAPDNLKRLPSFIGICKLDTICHASLDPPPKKLYTGIRVFLS